MGESNDEPDCRGRWEDARAGFFEPARAAFLPPSGAARLARMAEGDHRGEGGGAEKRPGSTPYVMITGVGPGHRERGDHACRGVLAVPVAVFDDRASAVAPSAKEMDDHRRSISTASARRRRRR